MSHPLLLRHSPTLATQPPSTAAQQKGAKKVQLCGKSGFTWWREVHWQSSCEEQRFGRFRVRQQNTSGQTLPNPRRPSNYRLAPMNSALSGDERTRRYGDTGMGASRTLGTSPPRVTTGPWPSLPAGALFYSQLKHLSSKPFTFNSHWTFEEFCTKVFFERMKLCFLFLDTVACPVITYEGCVSAFCDLRKTLHSMLCQSVQMLCQAAIQKQGKTRMKQN